MKYFLVVTLFLLSSCGLFREEEPKAPVVESDTPKESCVFPDINVLIDPKQVTEEMVHTAINCAEKNVHLAFSKVRGTNKDEISFREIRELHNQGVVNLKIDDDRLWDALEEAMPLFHPKQKPVLSKDVFDSYVSWARKHVSFAFKGLNTDKNNRDALADWMNSPELSEAILEFTGLLFEGFDLSLGKAQRITSLLYDYRSETHYIRQSKAQILDYLEAVWVLKSFLLEEPRGNGLRSSISGKSIQKFLKLSAALLNHAKKTTEWGIKFSKPTDFSPELVNEWTSVAKLLSAYIENGSFNAIDQHLLARAIAKISPGSPLSSLTGDLVLISQRLAPKGKMPAGVHPISLLKFLSRAETTAKEIEEAAKAIVPFCTVTNYGYLDCALRTREALAHPLLKHVALKGALDMSFNHPASGNSIIPIPKRLDMKIRWGELVERVVTRSVMVSIFDAFDRKGNGNIPIHATNEDELKDTLDLAYTFLRFAAVPKKDPSKSEEEVSPPQQIQVKPDKLAKVMGLIGDKWMNDGNSDGMLNAEEFFSVTSVYEDIQRRANWVYNNNTATNYCLLDETRPASEQCTWQRADIRARKDFIQKAKVSYSFMDYVDKLLSELAEDVRESFFHALIGVPRRTQVEALPYAMTTAPSVPVILQHYVEADATLAPTAIFVILERLMHRCDLNEDDRLSWKELDCAAPLLLEAAHETVQSQLVELDPGVNDGAKLLLGFLKTPGLPTALAKLILMNGSVTKLNLTVSGDDFQLDWRRLGEYLGGTPGAAPWIHEAKTRFGRCDTSPQNDILTGKEELDCVAKTIVERTLASLSDAFRLNVTPAALEQMSELLRSEQFLTFLKLSTQSDETLNLNLEETGHYSSPKKMVELFEEIIRRGTPLWQMQD